MSGGNQSDVSRSHGSNRLVEEDDRPGPSSASSSTASGRFERTHGSTSKGADKHAHRSFYSAARAVISQQKRLERYASLSGRAQSNAKPNESLADGLCGNQDSILNESSENDATHPRQTELIQHEKYQKRKQKHRHHQKEIRNKVGNVLEKDNDTSATNSEAEEYYETVEYAECSLKEPSVHHSQNKTKRTPNASLKLPSYLDTDADESSEASSLNDTLVDSLKSAQVPITLSSRSNFLSKETVKEKDTPSDCTLSKADFSSLFEKCIRFVPEEGATCVLNFDVTNESNVFINTKDPVVRETSITNDCVVSVVTPQSSPKFQSKENNQINTESVVTGESESTSSRVKVEVTDLTSEQPSEDPGSLLCSYKPTLFQEKEEESENEIFYDSEQVLTHKVVESENKFSPGTGTHTKHFGGPATSSVIVDESEEYILEPSRPSSSLGKSRRQQILRTVVEITRQQPLGISVANTKTPALRILRRLSENTVDLTSHLGRTGSSVDPRLDIETDDESQTVDNDVEALAYLGDDEREPGTVASGNNSQNTSQLQVNQPATLSTIASSAASVVSSILATAPSLDNHLTPNVSVASSANGFVGPIAYGPTLAGFATTVLNQIIQAHLFPDDAPDQTTHHQRVHTGSRPPGALNRRRRLRTSPATIPPRRTEPRPQRLAPPLRPGAHARPGQGFNFPAPETRPNPPPANIFTRVNPIPAPLLVQLRTARPQQENQQNQQQQIENQQHAEENQQQNHQHAQQQRDLQVALPRPPPPPPLPLLPHRHIGVGQHPQAHEIDGQHRLSTRHMQPPPPTPGSQRRHSASVRRPSSIHR